MAHARWGTLAGALLMALLMALLVALLVALLQPLSAAAFAPDTDSFVHVVGMDTREPESAQTWTESDYRLQMGDTGSGLHVYAAKDADIQRSFDLHVDAPLGEELVPGVYEDATDGHDRGDVPRLDLSNTGCRMTDARFEIFDLDVAAERLLMTFEVQCAEGLAPVFGEVAFNQPRADSAISTLPSRIAWPEQYPGAAERDVAVRVTNHGVTALPVDDVSITGDDDFAVRDNDCAVLAPGASCTVTLGFTPSEPGPRAAEFSVGESSSGRYARVPLRGSGIKGTNGLRLRSEPGDLIGKGLDDAVAPEDLILYEATDTEIFVYSDTWLVAFYPPRGHVLAPGQVFDSTPDHSVLTAFLRDSGECQFKAQRVRIREAAYDEGGQLKRLNASFVQQCRHTHARLFGTFAYRSTLPFAKLPPRTDVAFEDRIYAPGDNVSLEISLDDSVAERTVLLTPEAEGRNLKPLGRWRITGGETLSATVTVPRLASTLVLTGVDGEIASNYPRLDARDRVTVRLPSQPRSEGEYAVYPRRGAALVKGRIHPAQDPQKLRFTVQAQRESGQWHTAIDPITVKCDKHGRATFTLESSRALRGKPLRLRGKSRSFRTYPGISDWALLRFGKQA